MTALLDVANLEVSFSTRHGTVPALRGVSVSLAAGQTLGLVGESGSGKSVTALAIMRLLDRAGRITAGSIRFRGRDITSLGRGDLRQLRGAAMSMIFQNPRAALNPIRTVGEQLADVLRAHDRLSAREAQARALGSLEAVLIRDPVARLRAYPSELSGGMCQRVMIAMAIACEPDLLIADEPTTGLDVTTQRVVMDLLARITAERGMAMVLITHDLGLAARYCDAIAVMEHGVLLEQGPTAALFRAPQCSYTRRLIAASPTRTSRLADLTPDAPPLPPLPKKPSPSGRGLGGTAQGSAGGSPWNGSGGEGSTWIEVGRTAPHPDPLPKGEGACRSPLLELRGVSKSFGATPAVRDVGFALPPGGSLGLVGESGSGKSTLSRLVCRLLDLDTGSIHFAGEAISAVPARDFHRSPWRRHIQIVFQDAGESLNPRFTAWDSIAHPLRRLEGLRDGAALTGRVEQAAARAGLGAELLTRLPHQLSGGQKARVGIARAIAVRPRLLVLDEPTAALDVSIQAAVLQLLDRLRREDGMALLFVSHDLNVVRMMCDQLVVLQAGQVVEAGPSATVFARPAAPYTQALLDAIPHFDPAQPEPSLQLVAE